MKKLFLRKAPLGERGDVPGWVLIWGVASERLVEIFNRAMDSIAGI